MLGSHRLNPIIEENKTGISKNTTHEKEKNNDMRELTENACASREVRLGMSAFVPTRWQKVVNSA